MVLTLINSQHALDSRLCFIIGLSRDASFIQNYKKEFWGTRAWCRNGGRGLKRAAQSEAELIRNLAKLSMQHSSPRPPHVLKLGKRFPEYFERSWETSWDFSNTTFFFFFLRKTKKRLTFDEIVQFSLNFCRWCDTFEQDRSSVSEKGRVFGRRTRPPAADSLQISSNLCTERQILCCDGGIGAVTNVGLYLYLNLALKAQKINVGGGKKTSVFLGNIEEDE